MSSPLVMALLTAALGLLLLLDLGQWLWPAPPAGGLARRLRLQGSKQGSSPEPTAAPLPGATAPPGSEAAGRQRLQWLAVAALVGALVGGLFGGAAGALPLAAAAGYGAWRRWPRLAARRRREQLHREFRVALAALATSLRSGASVPTALERLPADLALALGPGVHPMAEEAEQIREQLRSGAAVEQALERFAQRAELEDATAFVSIARLCRRRGGDMAAALSQVAEVLAGKMAVAEQIRTLTAGKRGEAWLLALFPPLLLAGMALVNPGYLAPLLTTLPGRVMLGTAALLVLLSAAVAQRLLRIEI